MEVIDEDQGLSGRSQEGRLGFQRLLAEVSLDHVGLILGLEMSRLARSCEDWHQLLELCAIFRTLLGDQDGLYDPTEFNDRLLLGLKGTMVQYSGQANRLRYQCARGSQNLGEPLCQGLVGRDLDHFIAERVLKVLEPASLELCLAEHPHGQSGCLIAQSPAPCVSIAGDCP